ncbi:MAG: DUF898 family protein, partial [Clostridia bacterium]
MTEAKKTNDSQCEVVSTSKFSGGALGLFGVNLITLLCSVITLGIAYPWLVCYKYRWITKHTIISDRQLVFDGRGAQLIGSWIKWIFLIIITLGIYSFWLSIKLLQWTSKHTYCKQSENNPKTSKFDGGVLGLLCIKIVTVIGVALTLGLALPWIICWHQRWETSHTYIEGSKLTFEGKGIKLFGNYIKWFLLTLITLGIYGFWLTVNVLKWN